MSATSLVVLSEDISEAGKAILEERAKLILAPDTSEATTARLLAEADGLVLRASTQVTREVLSCAGNLRIIARTGVGYNNVDVAAATEKGIPVTIVPGANEHAVAEHAIAMVLALSKQIFFMDRAVRDGNWAARFSPTQREIRGRVLGLVGYGHIGKLTAAKAQALGMHVIAHDPALWGEQAVNGIKLAHTLEELLPQVDFISLHLPATPETRQLFNGSRFKQMKRGAFLVNTSRGELVDEVALVHVLSIGHLAGAALDVFAVEPPKVDNPLFKLPNVILSPHAAGSTFEANERLAIGAAQAVLDVLEGRTPANVVNPEALARHAVHT